MDINQENGGAVRQTGRQEAANYPSMFSGILMFAVSLLFLVVIVYSSYPVMDINQENGGAVRQTGRQEAANYPSMFSGILMFAVSLLFLVVVSHFLNSERIQLQYGRIQLRDEQHQQVMERDHILKDRNQLRKERDQLIAERNQLKAERDQLLTERQQLQKERFQIMTKWSTLVKELEKLYMTMKKGMEEDDGGSYFDYFYKGFRILEPYWAYSSLHDIGFLLVLYTTLASLVILTAGKRKRKEPLKLTKMFQEVKRFLTTTDPLKIILCIILIVLIIIIVLLVIMNYQLYVERKQLLEERNVLRWEFQRLRRLEENASGIHDGGFIYFVKKAANILDVVSPFIKFFV